MPQAPEISPSPDNYVVGKGVVSIAELTDGTPGQFTDLGNSPRFEYELTEESLPHRSSRSKVIEEDAEITIMTGYNLSFVLDEISSKNMQLFLRASLVNVTRLRAMQDLTKRYAIKFVSENAAGPDYVVEFRKVKLTPSGPMSLISDEINTLSFTGKGLADRAKNPDSPFFDFTFVLPTTTTTTTTAG